MSIEAKQILLKEMENILADKLTATTLESVIASIEQSMVSFTVEIDPEHKIENGFNELMDIFMETKRIEGRSEKTIEHYRYILSRLRDETNVPINKMTVFTLRSWLSKEQARGIGDKTLEGYRCVFTSYFGWLHKEGLVPSNPCANLGPIKCQKKVRTPYSDIDLEVLKESCDCNRDRALIEFLLSTGCRISEVCALNRDSVNFHDGECTVLGKGNKERTVFLSDVAIMLLQRYMDERKDTHEALFVGKGTERMTPGGVRARLKNIAKRGHVDNVHPHRFRRTLATNLIDRGMNIQEVATILGHEKLDTTLKYVYINKSNVKNAYKKYA